MVIGMVSCRLQGTLANNRQLTTSNGALPNIRPVAAMLTFISAHHA